MKHLLKEISKKLDILLEKHVAEHCDYVVINGLKWDRENTEFTFAKHFTFNEANHIAADLGKRLPTKQEFEELLALGSTWDKEKQGRWFGYDHTKKSQSKRSVFFPAAGFHHSGNGVLYNADSHGYYWISPRNDSRLARSVYFSSTDAHVNNSVRNHGLSVRYISE